MQSRFIGLGGTKSFIFFLCHQDVQYKVILSICSYVAMLIDWNRGWN